MNIDLSYLRPTSKSLYIRLIVLVHLIFSYNVFPWWWSSILGSIIIIYLAKNTWKNYLEWIGLRLNTSSILFSTLILGLVCVGSYLSVSNLAYQAGVYIVLGSTLTLIHIIGYTLNEEMIVGAILLNYLAQRFKRVSGVQISILVALVFSILHFIFYRWVFQDGGLLSPVTLLSLFAVGVIRNSLILYSGHIGYAWAIHAGWIFIMFGFDHMLSYSDTLLTEADRFNLYLGNAHLLTVLLVLAAIGILILHKYPSKRYVENS